MLAEQHTTLTNQWPVYQYNSNFSPLTQITPENVSTLTEAWTFHYGGGSAKSGSLGLDYRFEVQPLLIGGVMYFSTPGSQRTPNVKSTITALEPETGKVLWQFDSPYNIHGRGIAYWPGDKGTAPRLVFATDKGYLAAVDMKTHQLATNFGNKGLVDAYVGVASEKVGESRRNTFSIPNPVSIYKNLIITAARPGEGEPPQPRGDIRAWDVVTGKLVWDFHVIPWPGEPNHDDWTGDTWKDRSGANTWSNFTVDDKLGIVFAPTGDSNHADTAPGKNLYSNTLLAIDAATGKLKWYHQLVHHDVWDFDLPTPPILVTVHKDGKDIPAVVQTGKMAYVYIFDRETGEPIYGMEERPVERTDNPKDQSWPTQPFPLKPEPVARVGMGRADVNKMTPEIEQFCTNFWDTHHMMDSGPYTQPITGFGTVTFRGGLGGPNWGPMSYNPQLGYVYVSSFNSGAYRAASSTPAANGGAMGGGGGARPANRAAGGGTPADSGRVLSAEEDAPAPPPAAGGRNGARESFAYKMPDGTSVPCAPPPYGQLTAVDVNTGEIAWTSTLGLNESLASLGDIGLHSGTRSLGGNISTASGLIFIAATNDHRFRAFDAKTGKELWVTELPASGHSTPVTYMGKDGSQYVVIAASGGTAVGSGLPISDSLVAYKLPR